LFTLFYLFHGFACCFDHVTALCPVACTLDAALDMHTHTLDTNTHTLLLDMPGHATGQSGDHSECLDWNSAAISQLAKT
jgi:hypothetical protein